MRLTAGLASRVVVLCRSSRVGANVSGTAVRGTRDVRTLNRKRGVVGSTSDQIKGTAKEAVGTVTGDKDLEAEGAADRQAGEAKEKVEQAVDKVEGAAAEVIDKVKDTLHGK